MKCPIQTDGKMLNINRVKFYNRHVLCLDLGEDLPSTPVLNDSEKHLRGLYMRFD